MAVQVAIVNEETDGVIFLWNHNNRSCSRTVRGSDNAHVKHLFDFFRGYLGFFWCRTTLSGIDWSNGIKMNGTMDIFALFQLSIVGKTRFRCCLGSQRVWSFRCFLEVHFSQLFCEGLHPRSILVETRVA